MFFKIRFDCFFVDFEKFIKLFLEFVNIVSCLLEVFEELISVCIL